MLWPPMAWGGLNESAFSVHTCQLLSLGPRHKSPLGGTDRLGQVKGRQQG